MNTLAAHSAGGHRRAGFNAPAAAMGLIGSGVLAFGVFLSGFVISEPAPYEVLMVGQIAVWFLVGLRISRPVGVLLAFLLVFNAGGLLSLTVMKANFGDGFIYIAVSLFLALSSVFYAAAIEDSHRRLRLMFRAWVAAGVLTATLGILGYFRAFPGAEAFTRFDRATGAFQDPNVFGPFLAAPALYLMHSLLTRGLAAAPLRIAGLLVLVLGIFLSFSRAAWGLFAFASLAMVFIMLLKERSGAFRVKILVLSLAAVAVIVAALAVALQFEQVSQLLSSRTKLVQDYDGGHLGRFARHKIGFLMAMEKPLGIGPMVFSSMFPEDEHNTWLKALTTYGWIGFASFVAMTIATLACGLRILLRDRPWQPFLTVAWVTYLGHVLIGNVIDTDHWRHFYVLIGVIWGCVALEWRHERDRRAAMR